MDKIMCPKFTDSVSPLYDNANTLVGSNLTDPQSVKYLQKNDKDWAWSYKFSKDIIFYSLFKYIYLYMYIRR